MPTVMTLYLYVEEKHYETIIFANIICGSRLHRICLHAGVWERVWQSLHNWVGKRETKDIQFWSKHRVYLQTNQSLSKQLCMATRRHEDLVSQTQLAWHKPYCIELLKGYMIHVTLKLAITKRDLFAIDSKMIKRFLTT